MSDPMGPQTQCERCKHWVPEFSSLQSEGRSYCLDVTSCVERATPALKSEDLRALVQRILNLTRLTGIAAYRERMTLACDVAREFADYEVVHDHCSRIYDAVTDSRISKPMTNVQEVIAVYEDLWNKAVNEAEQMGRLAGPEGY